MGPLSTCGSATSHHATAAYVIYLANQRDTGKCQLQARQEAANQSELRHSSMRNVVTLEINSFLAFTFERLKD